MRSTLSILAHLAMKMPRTTSRSRSRLIALPARRTSVGGVRKPVWSESEEVCYSTGTPKRVWP